MRIAPVAARLRNGAAPVAALLLIACGGARMGEPGPPPPAPALEGVRVMLLPARAGDPEQLDRELEFWLTDRAPATDWVLPAELQAAADRAPGWRLRLDALPRRVEEVHRGELRVRDPLYGNLRRLGAVVDANYAFMPVAWVEAPDTAGVAGVLTAALVDVRGGRVLWMHTVRGEPSAGRDAAVTSAAAALARSLLPR